MTDQQRKEAQRLLTAATELQGAFWDRLLELEQTLSVRIDASRDLSDWSIDDIYECAEDDAGPIARLDE